MRHFLVCEAETAAFSPFSGEPHRDNILYEQANCEFTQAWRQKVKQAATPESHLLKLVSQQTARLWKLHYIFT